MDLSNVTILIPAYKPNTNMVPFLEKLTSYGFERIILVNDGSGGEFETIFNKATNIKSVEYLSHAINMGKGRALKNGINHYLNVADESSFGLVTADADGQHLPEDIVRIAEILIKTENTMVLGSRKLDNTMPLKSKFGNAVTRVIFKIVSGTKVYDTQTGLRGIPKSHLKKILALPGDKYEYEMAMLLELRNMEMYVIEETIETIYIDDNEGSHFHPIADSWKIYKMILGYLGSSAFSAVVDIVLYSYFFFVAFEGRLLLAVVFARIISSIVNFALNRTVLLSKHDNNESVRSHLLKYYSLAVIIVLLSYGFTYFLTIKVGISAVISKIICDSLLFILSFVIQKRLIFK